jgi:hypothetical protein
VIEAWAESHAVFTEKASGHARYFRERVARRSEEIPFVGLEGLKRAARIAKACTVVGIDGGEIGSVRRAVRLRRARRTVLGEGRRRHDEARDKQRCLKHGAKRKAHWEVLHPIYVVHFATPLDARFAIMSGRRCVTAREKLSGINIGSLWITSLTHADLRSARIDHARRLVAAPIGFPSNPSHFPSALNARGAPIRFKP